MINGLLLPGGNYPLKEGSRWYEAGELLFNLAIEANRKGVHFPVSDALLVPGLPSHASSLPPSPDGVWRYRSSPRVFVDPRHLPRFAAHRHAHLQGRIRTGRVSGWLSRASALI